MKPKVFLGIAATKIENDGHAPQGVVEVGVDSPPQSRGKPKDWRFTGNSRSLHELHRSVNVLVAVVFRVDVHIRRNALSGVKGFGFMVVACAY